LLPAGWIKIPSNPGTARSLGIFPRQKFQYHATPAYFGDVTFIVTAYVPFGIAVSPATFLDEI
jgi:hypothetical protein